MNYNEHFTRTFLHGRLSNLGGSVRSSLLSLLKWKAALSDVPEDVEAEAAAARESPTRRGDLAPLGLPWITLETYEKMWKNDGFSMFFSR